MSDKIYIVGHKNPDTDSICSAIGYCEFKRKKGEANVVPARLGKLNKETEFVLDYFGAQAPEIISTVKMQTIDVDIDPTVPIPPDTSIRKAWDIMKNQNSKTLTIVDEFGQLLGICTLSNLTQSYMDVSNNNILSESKTKADNILETLSGKRINNCEFDFSKTKNIIVAAMSENKVESNVGVDDVLIVGDRTSVQIKAINRGVGCLIITGNHKVDESVKILSEEKGCMIISAPYDSYKTSRLINMSVPVGHVMTTSNIISFDAEDFIDEIKEVMLDTRYRSYPVIKDNKVIGTISRYHLIKGKRKKVILVDHNETSQAVDGLDEAEIIEIIDHHRVGDIQTTYPVLFNNRPIGSTSTIVASMFFEEGIDISSKTAGLLCSAIISDTLFFKSPTSTREDVDVAFKLAKISGIDIIKYSNMMFKAGTSLADKTAKEIFYQDFKEFSLGKSKVGIGQVTTMDIEGINYMKEELLDLMKDIREAKGYTLVALMLTDIINEGSEILFSSSNNEIITSAFNIKPQNNRVYLPGVVSRKKQVIPPIGFALTSNR